MTAGASDVILAVSPVVDALDQVHAPYYVGGSVASSAHGVARATLDVDVIADLHTSQAAQFTKLLEGTFYVDEEMIRDILPDRPFDQESFSRRLQDTLDENSEKKFYLLSAEDVILHKLEWYRSGGEVSERQWGDVLGVLKVQSERLDRGYLRRWARQLRLDDLLRRVLDEAGLPAE